MILFCDLFTGKVYQPEKTLAHYGENRYGSTSAQYPQSCIFYKRRNCSILRYSYSLSLHVIGISNGRTLNPTYRSWIHSGNLEKHGIDDKKSRKFEQIKINRMRADYKSSDFEASGPLRDSIKSSDSSGEVVLEGNGNAIPWWEQFPKRWVIVLLCFAAFLLCNMDRVSYFLVLFMSGNSKVSQLTVIHLHDIYLSVVDMFLRQMNNLRLTLCSL